MARAKKAEGSTKTKTELRVVSDKAHKEVMWMLDAAPHWIDRGVTTSVLTSVGMLEDMLETALVTNMRPLSNKMRTRLFEGYGPLSTLAARADIAFAFQLVTEADYKALGIIRSVRNKFAHGRATVTFESEEIVSLMSSLICTGPKADDLYAKFFATLFDICRRLIDGIAEVQDEY